MHLKQFIQINELVREEVNVLKYKRYIGNTEKGKAWLVVDGKKPYWILGKKKIYCKIKD